MLVVVHNRYIDTCLDLFLHLKTFRRLYIFQVDAAEGGLKCNDDVNQLIGIGLVNLYVEDINASKLFKQSTLSLHDWFGGQRADIAEAKHRGAIGDDGHKVPARRHICHFIRLFLYQARNVCHTGRIG